MVKTIKVQLEDGNDEIRMSRDKLHGILIFVEQTFLTRSHTPVYCPMDRHVQSYENYDNHDKDFHKIRQ